MRASRVSTQATGHLDAFTKQTTLARFELTAGILTVAPSGPSLTEREAGVLDRDIVATIEHLGSSIRVLLIDLRNVEMMSSMGLGTCIEAGRLAEDCGAETVIRCPSASMLEMFRIMRLDRRFRIARTEEELRSALGADRRRRRRA